MKKKKSTIASKDSDYRTETEKELSRLWTKSFKWVSHNSALLEKVVIAIVFLSLAYLVIVGWWSNQQVSTSQSVQANQLNQSQAALIQAQNLLKQTQAAQNKTNALINSALKPISVGVILKSKFALGNITAVNITQPFNANLSVILLNTGFRPAILGFVTTNILCNYTNNARALSTVRYYSGEYAFNLSRGNNLLTLNMTKTITILVNIKVNEINITSNNCSFRITPEDPSKNILGSLSLPTMIQ